MTKVKGLRIEKELRKLTEEVDTRGLLSDLKEDSDESSESDSEGAGKSEEERKGDDQLQIATAKS